jgi:transposase
VFVEILQAKNQNGNAPISWNMYFMDAVILVDAFLMVNDLCLRSFTKKKKARTSDIKCSRNLAILVARVRFKYLFKISELKLDSQSFLKNIYKLRLKHNLKL